MGKMYLVRYGAIPEVARFENRQADPLPRGCRVIVQTHRGKEFGTVLEHIERRVERVNGTAPPGSSTPVNGNAIAAEEVIDVPAAAEILRPATDRDFEGYQQLRDAAQADFEAWKARIANWHLKLELIDLEWLVERERLILYVLNTRGPDCTKLAIYAAAAGFDNILVQPVGAEGLVQVEQTGGSCGAESCTCGKKT